MLRTATATARLLARPPARQLSTTPALQVRIRSSANPSGTSNPNPTAASTTPSPAEAPPSPPPETTDPSSFTPEVRQANPGSSTQAPTPKTETTPPPLSESNTPLTPPAAGAEVDEVQIPVDGKYKLPSLDIDPEVALPEPAKEEEGGSGRKRTGAGRKEYVSSIERQRKMWARMGLGAAGVAALVAAFYASQDETGDANGMSSWERLKANTNDMFDYFNKPAFKTLLPDPLPPPHQRPYTLVIDLEHLLVSSSWDRVQGWRTAKRPGVDYFLAYLSQFYEIVLFTNQPSYTAMTVAEKLDPFTAYLPYRLYRDSTRSVNGKVVKDLSYLNRDLSKVIMLDTNAEHAALQPENAVIIKPWEGKGNERGLVDLIPFLESIAIFNTPDVRPILKAYDGKDIPIEYAKKEEESKRAAIEEWERKNPNRSAGGGGGFLGGMFGSVSAPGQTRPNQPMTYLDQKRAQAQKMYEEEQKYWRDNAEEFKKLIEEDKQRQMAEMKGSLLGYIQGAGAPKPEEKKA